MLIAYDVMEWFLGLQYHGLIHEDVEWPDDDTLATAMLEYKTTKVSHSRVQGLYCCDLIQLPTAPDDSLKLPQPPSNFLRLPQTPYDSLRLPTTRRVSCSRLDPLTPPHPTSPNVSQTSTNRPSYT